MEMFDEQRKGLDADFSVEGSDGKVSALTVLFESAGGTGDKARNTDYDHALELLLRRAASVDASLTRVDVESREALRRPEEERQLVGVSFPVPLKGQPDFEALRRAITGAAARTARKLNAKGSGNPQKRLRLYVCLPENTKLTKQEFAKILAHGPGGDPSNYPAPAVLLSVADDRAATGRGRLNDEAKKKAIENHAMKRAADHFRSEAGGSWQVKDVANENRGYDLLLQRGEQSLYVEVKGTTTNGATVALTENEVESASKNPTQSVLIVVSRILVVQAGDDWHCSEGEVQILDNWNPREQGKLTPSQYDYTLPSAKT